MKSAQSTRFRLPAWLRTRGQNLFFGRPRVFISYRRDDLPEVAALACRAVTEGYGASVFLDVDTIAAGDDFSQIIKKSIHASDMVIAIIGPKWTGPLPDGEPPRIQGENDFVRLELEEAIRGGKPLTVLHWGPAPPPRDAVPRTLNRVLRPKWTNLSEEQLEHVIAREMRHLRRYYSWLMPVATVLLYLAVWLCAVPIVTAVYGDDGLQRRTDAAAFGPSEQGAQAQGTDQAQNREKGAPEIVITIKATGQTYLGEHEWPLSDVASAARSLVNRCRPHCHDERVYIRGERGADPAAIFGLVRSLRDNGLTVALVVQAQR